MKKPLVYVFLCALLLPAALLAQSPPSSDAYVASSAPTTNYGTKTILAVQNGVTSFVQFDLSAIPAGTTVNKATLRLYVDGYTGAGSFDVYQVTSAWSEKTVTYATIPTIGGSATGGEPVAIGSANRYQFVLIDITSLAQQWLNGSLANNGVALELTSSGGSFSFDSKESTATSHEPELEVVLDGPQGAQGPQGPQGPSGTQGAQGPQGLPGNLNPGSPYYIQNGSTQQTGTSFNIDGSGILGGTLTAPSVNTTNGYQIGGVTQFNANTTLDNVMIGTSAGNASITGGYNQLIGTQAGLKLTSGNSDVFIGAGAGQDTTTGNGDVYVGYLAGDTATTAAYNTFVGGQSGYSTTTAANNTFLGFDSGYYNTSGSNNLFLGVTSGAYNTTGTNNIYLAHGGVGTENNSTRIGSSQTAAFIAGIYGATVSTGAPVYIDSTGHLGTGGGILPSSELGGTYTQQVTFNNTTNVYGGTSVTVSGAVTGGQVNSTGGYQINGTTILNQDSKNDTMIGLGAGNPNITGGDSQFIGRSTGAALTSGNADVFIGATAGASTTTGNGDVYVGWTSGTSATTGYFNTFVGAQTGFYNTTGSSDLYLGFSAGITNTTGSNNIYLANGGVDGESNTIRIGGGQQVAFIAGVYGVTSGSGVPVYINSAGQLGTLTSSRKYKQDIEDMGNVTSALMKLRPVTFFYKPEYDKGERSRQYGLIAEEVAKVYPDLVAYNPDGSVYTVRYQYLSSMLLNEFQKQYRKAEAQTELIQSQQEKIEELESRLSRIESMLAKGAATADSTGKVVERASIQ